MEIWLSDDINIQSNKVLFWPFSQISPVEAIYMFDSEKTPLVQIVLNVSSDAAHVSNKRFHLHIILIRSETRQVKGK